MNVMLKMVNCRHLLGTGGRAYICTHKLRDETTFSKQRQGSCQFIFSLWQSVSVPNKVANVINSAVQFECDFVLKTANSLVVISFSFLFAKKSTSFALWKQHTYIQMKAMFLFWFEYESKNSFKSNHFMNFNSAIVTFYR